MKQSRIIGCVSSPPQHRMLWVPQRTDCKQVVVMSDLWGWVHMSRRQYPPILIVTSIICQTPPPLSTMVSCTLQGKINTTSSQIGHLKKRQIYISVL